MISVRFLLWPILPGSSEPTGLVVVQAPCGVARGALEAGVHVGAVVVAHVEHVVAALHGAGERLEADVVGAAVAAEGDELDALLELAALAQGTKGGLDAGERRGGVLEVGVDVAALPGGVRVARAGHLEAAGRAGDHVVAVDLREDLVHDDGGAAAAAEAVAAGEPRRLEGERLDLAAMVLVERRGDEGVEPARLDAVPTGDAPPLVQRDRAGEVTLLALAVRARGVAAHVDAVHRARLLAGAAEGAGVGAALGAPQVEETDAGELVDEVAYGEAVLLDGVAVHDGLRVFGMRGGLGPRAHVVLTSSGKWTGIVRN